MKTPSHNPPSLSSLVLDELNKAFSAQREAGQAALRATPTRRGLDHGVFVPFKVAFYPADAPLPGPGEAGPDSVLPATLPVVQISLPASDDAAASVRLGQALRSLRAHGVGVFSGGMGVHNMRDFRLGLASGKGWTDVPYASFTEDIKRVVTQDVPAASTTAAAAAGDSPPAPVSEAEAASSVAAVATDPRADAIVELTKTKNYHGAHPTAEHFLPIPVAIGATFPHERLYSTLELKDGAMGWNMFGTLPRATAAKV